MTTIITITPWRRQGETTPVSFPSQNMSSRRSSLANDVNGSPLAQGASSGRRGRWASQVVNLRNPSNHRYSTLKIGTWNVRSMLRPEKLENIKREMDVSGLNMLGLTKNFLGLTEVRWKEKGDINSDEYRVIHSGGDQSQRGVALILDKTTARSVSQVECASDRLMRVRLNGTPVDIVVIVTYMPTTDHDDEEVETVYEQVEDAIRRGRGDDYVIVMGDLNAVVGAESEEDVTGRYGLEKRTERGQMLVEFCKRNNMCITNTWYRQPKRRIYTWKAPGDLRRMQLDYIMVKKRYRNSVKDSHAFPGADVDSDHNLVTMKVTLTLKRLKQPARRLKWNLEALEGIGKEELNKGVTTRLLESGDSVEADTNAKWNTLKRAVIEGAEQNIGRERRRAAKKPWVTETMLRKMDERRKWKHVNNEEGKRKYRKLNNELRRETEKAREDYWVKQCLEIEDLEKAGKVDKMYRKVKELNRKRVTTENREYYEQAR